MPKMKMSIDYVLERYLEEQKPVLREQYEAKAKTEMAINLLKSGMPPNTVAINANTPNPKPKI